MLSTAASLRFLARVWRRYPLVPLSILALLVLVMYSFLVTRQAFNVTTVGIERLGYSDRIFVVHQRSIRTGNLGGVSTTAFNELAYVQGFQAVVPVVNDGLLKLNVGLPQGNRFLRCALAPSGLFTMFQARTITGRVFSREEDNESAGRAVLLSRKAWSSYFGSKSDVVGQQLRINGNSYTILGVLSDDLSFVPGNVAIWINRIDAIEEIVNDGIHLRAPYTVYALLKDGQSPAAVQQQLESIYQRLANDNPLGYRGRRPVLAGLRDEMLAGTSSALRTALWLVTAVFALGAGNSVLLLAVRRWRLARTNAIRLALGMRRHLISLESFAESAVLVLAAVVLSVLMARYATPALLHLLNPGFADILEFPVKTVDYWLLALMAVLAAALLTLPACWKRADDAGVEALQPEASRPGIRGARGVWRRAVLIAIQVGMAACILLLCGMAVRVLVHVYSSDLGFDPRDLVIARISSSGERYHSKAAIQQYRARLMEKIAQVPAVLQRSAVSFFPLLDNYFLDNLTEVGKETSTPLDPSTQVELFQVDKDYFRVMGIPLLRGAVFAGRSSAEDEGSIVLDEDAAKQLGYSFSDVIGKHVSLIGKDRFSVIGVVKAMRFRGEPGRDRPRVFIKPQSQARVLPWSTIVIKSGVRAKSMVAAIEKAGLEVDPEMPFFRVESVEDVLAEATSKQRRLMSISMALGVGALLISLAGAILIVSQLVASRRRECGIRIAIGASRFQIVKQLCGPLAVMALAGTIAGLALATLLMQWMGEYYYAITRVDVVTIASVGFLVWFSSVCASIVPVRSLLRLPPNALLR